MSWTNQEDEAAGFSWATTDEPNGKKEEAWSDQLMRKSNDSSVNGNGTMKKSVQQQSEKP